MNEKGNAGKKQRRGNEVCFLSSERVGREGCEF
jgi:hypothetical protein